MAEEHTLDVDRTSPETGRRKTRSTNEWLKRSNDRWKNRRRMTWITFWTVIASFLYLLAFAPIERLSELGTLLAAFYTLATAIIGCYMGFATYDDVKANEFATPEYTVDVNTSVTTMGGPVG